MLGYLYWLYWEKKKNMNQVNGWPNMYLQWNPVNTVTYGLGYFTGKDQLWYVFKVFWDLKLNLKKIGRINNDGITEVIVRRGFTVYKDGYFVSCELIPVPKRGILWAFSRPDFRRSLSSSLPSRKGGPRCWRRLLGGGSEVGAGSPTSKRRESQYRGKGTTTGFLLPPYPTPHLALLLSRLSDQVYCSSQFSFTFHIENPW